MLLICLKVKLGGSLGDTSPIFAGILCKKPTESKGNSRFLKRTMVEKNGWNQPLEVLNLRPCLGWGISGSQATSSLNENPAPTASW